MQSLGLISSQVCAEPFAGGFQNHEGEYRQVSMLLPALIPPLDNHNILQGVAPPELRLTQEKKDRFDEWILKNGLRWTAEGGPLAQGGVDIAFIVALLLSCPHLNSTDV